MIVENVHERTVRATPDEASALLDKLASREDMLWPRQDWPPMRLDRPLGVGATGGHGPIRYEVTAYEPGRPVTFQFRAPKGFTGSHRLDVESVAGGSRIRHVLSMDTRGVARITWPLFFRPLHDALIEDALDRAEEALTGALGEKARWSLWVRGLRALAALASRPARRP